MNALDQYLESTRSAVQKLYQAVDSYYEFLRTPERPGFAHWGEYNADVKRAHEEWLETNEALLATRSRRDSEFAAEIFAITTLCGAVLQFAFMAIKTCSTNTHGNSAFSDLIPPNHKLLKFCIGPEINGVPIGLIVYAGRNQAHHYDDKSYNPITERVFERLKTWHSPTFKKSFSDDRFDLSNANIVNFAANILWLLEWQDYSSYEQGLYNLLS